MKSILNGFAHVEDAMGAGGDRGSRILRGRIPRRGAIRDEIRERKIVARER